MQVSYAQRSPMQGNYAALKDHVRSGVWISEQWKDDPRWRGRVLDVGCGGGPTLEYYKLIYKMPAQLDGLDPFDEVWQHPLLARRWQGEFEKLALPENEYDAIITINVVEHVSDPASFMRQAFRVLKPGGRMYALTPSGVHPFAWGVKLVQALGLKGRMVAGKQGWNDYPAMYRLNSPGAIARHGSAAGFEKAWVLLHPNMQWEQYWPGVLRVVPRAFDFVVGARVRKFHQQLSFYVEKPGAWAGVSGRMTEAELEAWRAANPGKGASRGTKGA